MAYEAQAVLGWQQAVDAIYQRQQAVLRSNAAPAAEYAGIQQFIHDEIVRNSASPTVTAIRLAAAVRPRRAPPGAHQRGHRAVPRELERTGMISPTLR